MKNCAPIFVSCAAADKDGKAAMANETPKMPMGKICKLYGQIKNRQRAGMQPERLKLWLPNSIAKRQAQSPRTIKA